MKPRKSLSPTPRTWARTVACVLAPARASITAAAVLALAAVPAAHAQVQAAFYAPFDGDTTGGRAPNPNQPFPYGSLVCTTTLGNASGFSVDFLSSATQTFLAGACGPNVAPQLMHYFGVRFTGSLVAPSAGMYNLTFDSDDGNVLTIDGNTIASHWAIQPGGPGSVSAMLNAGANPFVFDYYENSYGGAYATLQLPPGLPAQPPSSGGGSTVPEPSTWALFAGGLAGVAAIARRRRA